MKPVRYFPWLSLIVCFLIIPAMAQNRNAIRGVAEQATVPLLVEGNRPYIDVIFRRADGSQRSARLLIDSGGGDFLLTGSIARDLGLKLGKTFREDGEEFAEVQEPPRVFVGDFSLELNPTRVTVEIGVENMVPKGAPGHADGLLPGHVLAKYHVIFDYPGGKFTVARAGALNAKGTPLPMPVNPSSGFPRTEIEVAGKTYGFLIDTGASFTMVSEVVLKAWGQDHSDWQRHPGAYGEAATLGGVTLETMFVPAGRWGTNQLTEFGAVSQRQGQFENRMSSMMAAPIVGSLAGNVLKRFRVELDYPNSKLYLSQP
jgi:hypothetical protein